MSRCGCVKFSMPRDADTPVCGAKSVTCYNEAEDDHLWQEFYDGLSKASSYAHGGNTECNCLPSCTSISYDAELSQADFDWENLFLAYRNPTDEFPGWVRFAFFQLCIFLTQWEFIRSVFLTVSSVHHHPGCSLRGCTSISRRPSSSPLNGPSCTDRRTFWPTVAVCWGSLWASLC